MLEDQIRELEERLTTPGVRSSAEALDLLVSDQFLEFGSSGQTYTKRDVIAQLLAKPNVHIAVTDLRVLALSEDVALATYRTVGSLRSSVWRREGEHWRIIFHQGTPVTTAT